MEKGRFAPSCDLEAKGLDEILPLNWTPAERGVRPLVQELPRVEVENLDQFRQGGERHRPSPSLEVRDALFGPTQSIGELGLSPTLGFACGPDSLAWRHTVPQTTKCEMVLRFWSRGLDPPSRGVLGM